MRTTTTFHITDVPSLKQKLLEWAQQFETVVWLDSNEYQGEYRSFEAILAVDAHSALTTNQPSAFDELKEYQTSVNDWIFGYLTYDLKNCIEDLNSTNSDSLDFPGLFFFQPKRLFLLKGDLLEISYLNSEAHLMDQDFKNISKLKLSKSSKKSEASDIKIKLRIHKDDYFSKVETMLHHIHRGDIYEANFCQEFYAEATDLNPLESFKKLNAISKPPFACFLKHEQRYLLSASPERYLKKTGLDVISQPIKGTAKRSEDPQQDLDLKRDLETDIKERSENIMIVDLVRNDLSHTAQKGSVEVKELCKIYSFLQVHQMISTVSSKLQKHIHPVDLIKTTFPMGSMTGAPKISAMKIIENLEETKRGLYSGSVGYVTPEGDFDFNVVIRSILYNAFTQYISFSVGSAITARSNPQSEYEECLVKAKAMREVLEH